MSKIHKAALALPLALGLLLVAGCTSGAEESGPEQPLSVEGGSVEISLPADTNLADMNDVASDVFAGKSVIFVPQGLGYPIHDSQNAELALQMGNIGVDYEVMDPANDPQKQVANLQAAIQKKPDVLVVISLDPQITAKLLTEAQDAGIYVIQSNLQSTTITDAYVGPDFRDEGLLLGQLVAEKCEGKKVGLLHALPNSSFDIAATDGFKSVADESGMTIVSEQSSGLDPSVAATMSTAMMQQSPDLCGIAGTYDESMIGAGNAVSSAGKTGKIGVWTMGGGNASCIGVRDGIFDGATASNGPRLGIQVASVIQMLLESNIGAGNSRFAVYTPLIRITAENYFEPNICYSVTK
ncbi:sugar ABC transporter substrate-binding protein [Cryobacterium sp. TMS1-20-1]|uniref:sugar ABC transporter substrate-binding protein n=1 Tax=Cryobacterium sp. TMS1-20-1 TaxID=1259223 RepID=UPI00106AF5C0|nr:sugar ABC transporter substrate-binding protein [Cryobacterium sp. TMS1-20-1]TFC80530.1 sugar ABC transporter substrate-binding protein [Cryobacterium sp. TMS1-20-1]